MISERLCRIAYAMGGGSTGFKKGLLLYEKPYARSLYASLSSGLLSYRL